MTKIQRLIIILWGLSAASIVWAQTAGDELEASAEAESPVETPIEAPSDEVVNDDIDVDDGSYIDAEEDDFRPSEEIPADQSIDFPTDI